MARELPKLSREPLADLFSTQEQRDDAKREHIDEIAISEIDNFTDHPFKVRDNAEMDELTQDVAKNGVLMPCIVRPKEGGRYEMIAGHRRKHAALRAGVTELPCIIRKLTDDEATILMVKSNKHRETILPSEKAFAYRMELEAMNKQAGRPRKENLTPVVSDFEKVRTSEKLGKEAGESREQIRRYVRLTNLLPELLQMVDNTVEKPDDKTALQMAMRPAVELSYLTQDNQRVVLEFMESSMLTPSHAQAIQLRKMQDAGKFTPQAVYALLEQAKPNQKEKVSLSVDKFNRYFPPNTSAKDIEKGIFKALDFYMAAKARQEHKQNIPKGR